MKEALVRFTELVIVEEIIVKCIEPLMFWFLGSVALSYGELLHATQNFSLAKEVYKKVIQGASENKDFSDLHAFAACNMSSEEVLLAATCALGQLEAHMG